MSNPNGGGGLFPLPTAPASIPSLPEVLDPEVEELWSSRALLLVSRGSCTNWSGVRRDWYESGKGEEGKMRGEQRAWLPDQQQLALVFFQRPRRQGRSECFCCCSGQPPRLTPTPAAMRGLPARSHINASFPRVDAPSLLSAGSTTILAIVVESDVKGITSQPTKPLTRVLAPTTLEEIRPLTRKVRGRSTASRDRLLLALGWNLYQNSMQTSPSRSLTLLPPSLAGPPPPDPLVLGLLLPQNPTDSERA